MKKSLCFLSLWLMVWSGIGCASYQRGQKALSPLDQIAGSFFNEADMEKTLVSLERFLETENENTSALFLLADILDMMGQPDRALPLYLKVIRIAQAREEASGEEEAIASAMAIVAIRDRVANFHNVFLDSLHSINFSAGNLPPEAWFQLMNLYLGGARRTGDSAAARRAVTLAGCITQWQAVGPLGPYVWKDFDNAPLPSLREEGEAKDSSVWPATLDAGPGRGMVKSREVDTDTCFVSLQNPTLPPGGKTWARTTVALGAAQRVRFRLQTHDGARVFVGGKELLVIDPRKAFWPKVHWFEAHLPAGATDITVMLATDSSAPGFALAAMGPAGQRAWTKSDPSIPAVGIAEEYKPTKEKAPDHAIGKYAAIKRFLWWDHAQKATDLLREISPLETVTSPALLLALSEALQVDESLPYELAFERSRSLEAKALEREPRLWQARIHLADRKADDDLFLEAVEILKKGIELSPNEPKLYSRLASLFLNRGFWHEAETAIHSLEKIVPGACDTWRYKLALDRENHQLQAIRDSATSLVACDSSSTALAEELSRTYQFDLAIKERQRLAQDDRRSVGKAYDLYRALLAKGESDKALDQLVAAREIDPFDPDLIFSLVDMLAARGERGKALSVLTEAEKIKPELYSNILDAKSLLQNSKMFEEFRVNGLKTIDSYRSEKQSYDTASVFVLDRAVYMVSPWGSLTTIVHTITHLRTDEAIEQLGEFELPEDAKLLTARTIKPDGRILEPEDIERKDTFSFPDLEPDDMIETEYLTFAPRNQLFPGGFDTERFYFQNYDTAFHLSEMIAIVPKSMDVVVDGRGNHPPTQKRVDNGNNIFEWRATDVLPHLREPLSPSAKEFLPSIRLTSRASWSNLLYRIRDLLADKNRESPTIRNALTAATRGLGKHEHRLRKASIYRWVQENIRPDGNLFEQGSHIIARRNGHTARAFMALLRAAGYSCDLALVKPQGADEHADKIPDLGEFDEIVVKVKDDGFISLLDPYAPYGYLPAAIRKRPAVLISSGERTMTGGGIIPVDTQQIRLDLTLRTNESAQGTVTETLNGTLASHFREEFENAPELDRNRLFESQYLSKEIPGAKLKNLTIQNETDPQKPLILIYEIEILHFGVTEGNTRRLKVPFTITLAKQVGGLAKRQTPLVLASHISKEVEATIRLPRSVSVVASPSSERPQKFRSPFGEARSWVDVSPKEVTMGYRAKLHVDRIEQKLYDAFLDFAEKIDALSGLELVLQ